MFSSIIRKIKNKFRLILEGLNTWGGRNPKLASVLVALLFILICFSTYVFVYSPSNFPKNSFFTIEEGESLSSVSQRLFEQNYIDSQFFFKTFVFLFHHKSLTQAGDYYFANGASVFKIASRTGSGNFGLDPVLVTIPEGLNVFQIADLLAPKFPKFNKDDFVHNASEGYMFPDTYFFPPNIKASTVIETMRQNFDSKIVIVNEDIKKFGKPINDVITMASILEEEARRYETKQIIAGILWKRISIGMALQVDSSFAYVNGKNTYELTTEDLATDSPYNTYKNLGLPPTPISNPGLDTIRAAVNPIETKYLFFLSDKDGVMHYAATHDGHIANRQRYLGK